MSNFTRGDDITIAEDYMDVTVGKVYVVTAVSGIGNPAIIDDAGDEHYIQARDCTLVPHQGAMGAGQRQASRAKTRTLKPSPVLGITADVLICDDIAASEDDYDTRKANASVISLGLFAIGTRLVYKDGTPTLTSLTVKQCTATCVWFEETYSAAFDPNEFTVEYYDE